MTPDVISAPILARSRCRTGPPNEKRAPRQAPASSMTIFDNASSYPTAESGATMEVHRG